MIISYSIGKVDIQAQLGQAESFLSRLKKRFLRIARQRRFIRYGILGLNVVLLITIVAFIVQTSPTHTGNGGVGANLAVEEASNPLDQLSSADIAVNLAQMTNLPELGGVVEKADSVSAELTAPPAQTTVIAKPLAVATALKSGKDITTYTVQSGETVASIAAKFNVTSDSVLWSNGLTGNTVTPGLVLLIPPINGIVYTVKAGDTPDSLAQKFRANKEQIIAYNDAEISGLVDGSRIIIPNGQQPAPVVIRRSTYIFTGGYNGYDRGFCTWYVANRRAEIGRPIPGGLGNASTWDNRAPAAGLLVNRTPAFGAAAVTSQRGAGHVVFVEHVYEDGSFWASEMNSRGQVSMTNPAPAGGWGKVDWKFFTAAQAATFEYIH